MATSERSFSDRLSRAVLLKNAIAGMDPAFAPADTSLSPMLFGTFLTDLEAANDAVETTKNDWKSAIAERVADAATAKTVTTQLIAYVKSNSAWALKLPRIKELADKVRGFSAPRTIAPPPAPEPGAPPPPPVKKRDRGDGSFADLATQFKALSDAVGKLQGYAPPDPAISATTLGTLATKLRTNNDAVAAADSALDSAQRERFAAFCDGEDCLQVKFQAVKNAVKGQYGQGSTQYAEVKGIRW